jgi:hypothetical protein
MLRHLAVCSLLVLAAPAFAEEAQPAPGTSSLDPSFKGKGSVTDASPQRRRPLISVFLGLPAWYWGYGGVPFSLGGRYLLPILHDGFAPTLNDSFSVEFGADFIGLGRSAFAVSIGIPAELMWALHITPKFAAYLKAGIALELNFGDWSGFGAGRGFISAGPIVGIGGWYAISDGLRLRLELGYPGLKIGLGFPT